MLLASILIDGSAGRSAPVLPATVQENIASFRKCHPDLPHKLFGEDDIVDLIESKFSAEVLSAYRSLRPYAYKADLARYCILHEYGGIYADLSYFFKRAVPIHGKRAVVFRDFLWSSPWDASVGLIYAEAGHEAVGRAIELVCANVAKGYYGTTPLCPTGPALFGRALAMACDIEELGCGTAALIPRARVQQIVRTISLPDDERIHCLMFNQRLIAVKRKGWGAAGLADLGVAHGNAYVPLWKNGEIYKHLPRRHG